MQIRYFLPIYSKGKRMKEADPRFLGEIPIQHIRQTVLPGKLRQSLNRRFLQIGQVKSQILSSNVKERLCAIPVESSQTIS